MKLPEKIIMWDVAKDSEKNKSNGKRGLVPKSQNTNLQGGFWAKVIFHWRTFLLEVLGFKCGAFSMPSICSASATAFIIAWLVKVCPKESSLFVLEAANFCLFLLPGLECQPPEPRVAPPAPIQVTYVLQLQGSFRTVGKDLVAGSCATNHASMKKQEIQVFA